MRSEARPFRYGDYSSLKRNYLPPDYLRDAAGLNIVKTVHEEADVGPLRSGGRAALARTGGAANTAIRMLASAPRCSRATTSSEVLAGHAKYKLDARRAQLPDRGRQARRREARRAGSMDDPKWRRGYALLEKYGLSFDVQTPWWHLDALAELARDFPNTQIVIVHTGAAA